MAKLKKINWREEGVKVLAHEYGREEAERIYENTYRQVLHKWRKTAVGTSNINITFETTQAIKRSRMPQSAIESRKTKQFADVKVMPFGPAQIDLKFTGESEYLSERFAGMARAYGEVDNMLREYQKGNISAREFLNFIDDFTDTSDYQDRHAGSPN